MNEITVRNKDHLVHKHNGQFGIASRENAIQKREQQVRLMADKRERTHRRPDDTLTRAYSAVRQALDELRGIASLERVAPIVADLYRVEDALSKAKTEAVLSAGHGADK